MQAGTTRTTLLNARDSSHCLPDLALPRGTMSLRHSDTYSSEECINTSGLPLWISSLTRTASLLQRHLGAESTLTLRTILGYGWFKPNTCSRNSIARYQARRYSITLALGSVSCSDSDISPIDHRVFIWIRRLPS